MNAKWTVLGIARVAAAAAMLAVASLGSQAQAPYPNKPIKMIMPFAPGSGRAGRRRAAPGSVRPARGPREEPTPLLGDGRP